MTTAPSAHSSDPLEGITEKTTKADMLKRLNELADRLRGHEKQRTGRLADIEARVRAKYKPGDLPVLHNVIFTATTEEWNDAIDFLDMFDDILPVPLQRIRTGGHKLLVAIDEDANATT